MSVTVWPALPAGVTDGALTFISSRPDPVAVTALTVGASLPTPVVVGGTVPPGANAFVELYVAALFTTSGAGTAFWRLQLNGSPIEIHTEGISDEVSGSTAAATGALELSSNYSGTDVPFGPTTSYIPTEAYIRSEMLGLVLTPGDWAVEFAAWKNSSGLSFTISQFVAVVRTYGLTDLNNIPIPPPPQPPTVDTLDDFNRANNASLGANYTTPVISSAGLSPRVVSNQCGPDAVSTGDSYSSAYWSAALFGPNCEVYYEVGSGAPQEGVEIFARLTGLDGSPSGYSLDGNFQGNHSYRLSRYDNGVQTYISSAASITPQTGDQFILVCNGTNIYGYHLPVGATSRNLILSATDNIINTAGRVGLSLEAGTTRINQWGAQNIPVLA